MLSWGSAQHGQLGHGRKQREDVLHPAPVAALSRSAVEAVSCGHFHSAALTDVDGRLSMLTWGRGSLGVLGHGDEEEALQPSVVASLQGVSVCAISCGAYQTAAVTSGGELYAWGWQLEQTELEDVIEGFVAIPQRMRSLSSVYVRSVSCGHYCAAAVSTDGALFTWGKGTSGQLAHGDENDVLLPTRVAALQNDFVWSAAFGRHFLLTLTSQVHVPTLSPLFPTAPGNG